MLLEDLLSTALLRYINQKKAGDLPQWTGQPDVQTEDVDDKVFGIRDVKGTKYSIKCDPRIGEATYYNGDDQHQYSLRFIRYDEFVCQFRTCDKEGKIAQDWTKNWSRPDYLVYDISDQKRCVIIHELSIGKIKNKRQDGKIQLLNTVVMFSKIPEIKAFLNQFEGRCYCFLSADGCVDSTPMGMADGFMEIYQQLPDPIPINNNSIIKRGFQAFETKVVKL